jgi:hypothetical protein
MLTDRKKWKMIGEEFDKVMHMCVIMTNHVNCRARQFRNPSHKLNTECYTYDMSLNRFHIDKNLKVTLSLYSH